MEEVRKTPKPVAAAASTTPEAQAAADAEPQAEVAAAEDEKPAKEASASSDSESEEEAEYHPQITSVSVEQIKEEPEEEEQEEAELNEKQQQQQPEPATEPEPGPIAEAEPVPEPASAQPVVQDGNPDTKEDAQPAVEAEDDGILEEEVMVTPDEAPNGYSAAEGQGLGSLEEEDQEPRVNGDASHVDTDHLPQVICCSEVIFCGREAFLSPPLPSSPLARPPCAPGSFKLALEHAAQKKK